MIEEVGDPDEETDVGEIPELSFVTQWAHGVVLATVAQLHACLLYTSPSPRDGV